MVDDGTGIIGQITIGPGPTRGAYYPPTTTQFTADQGALVPATPATAAGRRPAGQRNLSVAHRSAATAFRRILVNKTGRSLVYAVEFTPRRKHSMPSGDIYKRYIEPEQAKLVAAAWRIVGNEPDALDALQTGISRIWRERDKLPAHPNPSAWMRRIVLNAACDILRAGKQRRAEELQPDATATGDSPDSAMDRVELRDRLLKEVSRLSANQRQAVLLRLVEGLEYDDIAAALNCTSATARVHVQRGREALRARLADLSPHPPTRTP